MFVEGSGRLFATNQVPVYAFVFLNCVSCIIKKKGGALLFLVAFSLLPVLEVFIEKGATANAKRGSRGRMMRKF